MKKRVRRMKVGSVGQFFQDACLCGQEFEKSFNGNVGSRRLLFLDF